MIGPITPRQRGMRHQEVPNRVKRRAERCEILPFAKGMAVAGHGIEVAQIIKREFYQFAIQPTGHNVDARISLPVLLQERLLYFVQAGKRVCQTANPVPGREFLRVCPFSFHLEQSTFFKGPGVEVRRRAGKAISHRGPRFSGFAHQRPGVEEEQSRRQSA